MMKDENFLHSIFSLLHFIKWKTILLSVFLAVSLANISHASSVRLTPKSLTSSTEISRIIPRPSAWENPKLIRILEDHKGTVESLSFSPDGKILASGGGSLDPKIRIWDLQKGEKIRTLKGHKTRVLAVAIAPDGETLASGSDDSLLNIWNFKTGNSIIRS